MRDAFRVAAAIRRGCRAFARHDERGLARLLAFLGERFEVGTQAVGGHFACLVEGFALRGEAGNGRGR